MNLCQKILRIFEEERRIVGGEATLLFRGISRLAMPTAVTLSPRRSRIHSLGHE